MRGRFVVAFGQPVTRASIFAGILAILTTVPTAAQQTRLEQVTAQQAEKASQLQPYTPTLLERRIMAVEQLFGEPPTFYPFIGSIMQGGLMSVGPGARFKLPGGALFDAHGALSLRAYKLAQTTLDVPLAGGLLKVKGEMRWLDAPRVAYFGVGTDTPETNRTAYDYQTATAGGWLQVSPLRTITAGGRLHYLRVTTARGVVPLTMIPETPGFDADPEYTVSGAFAEMDSRDGRAYSRRGGRYRVEWARYSQRNEGLYSFDRIDAEANQFVPLLRDNWIIALRALASYTTTDGGNTVPYFMMPDLGGSRQLRGFASWRFRDRNRMLLTGEYRWTAGQFVDMALFLDAGKVAPTHSDLTFDHLKTSYGIGARFHTPTATPIRLELAKTNDGLAFIFGFGPSF